MNNSPLDNDALSPWWRHGAILVMIVGFAILSYMTVQTYRLAPPIPLRVVDEAGAVGMTREDIESGQEVFFKYGLMEHGTLWGHGMLVKRQGSRPAFFYAPGAGFTLPIGPVVIYESMR